MASPLTTLWSALREPAEALFDPEKRVYWPALATSGAIAALALYSRGLALRRLPGRLFSPRLWLQGSARVDYQLILLKALLRAGFLGSLGISTLTVAAVSAGGLRRLLGTPAPLGATLPVGLLFTVLAFLIEDWSRFFLHRLMHRVPLLWELHKVHHSAEVLTPFTLYRTHPLEALLNGARGAVVVGLLTGVFAWRFGPELRVYELLGVEAIGLLWTLLGANLRHSHIYVSYGRCLEHLLVSPAQHQLHHSRDPRHADRNFGTVLAVWDWLGGSLLTAEKPERLVFGLPDSEPSPGRSALELLYVPLAAAGRRLLRWPELRPVAATALLAMVSVTLGCSETRRLDRAVLLQSFGQCTLDRYRKAQLAATELQGATASFATMPSEATRATARAAFVKAMDAWQEAELLRYGPAADFLTLGGKGLRDSIYAWPDVNRCLIDTQLVGKTYEGAGFATTAVSTRGLAAIEYLLFYGGTDNGCGAQSELNASGSWAALSVDELLRRKAAYARVAAAEVEQRSRELIAAWEPSGFLTQLTSAGRGSTLFPTQQTAISAVAEAVFYLDTEVKDLKLATPLGLKSCASASCPESFESPWADRSRPHLRSNLAGLRVLLQGCEAGGGLGFDDLLEAVGAPLLAAQLETDLAAVDAALAAVPGDSLKQALASDRPSVERVYEAVKELTDFLKLEFSMALAITSKRVEGDHD